MFPNEVKDYTESYQWLWFNRQFFSVEHNVGSYQWFRFTIMNMWVDDAYDTRLNANRLTQKEEDKNERS